MKRTILGFLFCCSIFFFASCKDNQLDPTPEPAVVESDKCSLLKVSTANNGRPGSIDGGGQEYIYYNHRIIKQTDSRLPGVVDNYSIFEYDAAGRITSQKQFEPSDTTNFYAKQEYIYDTANRLIWEKIYSQSPAGNSTLFQEYKYSYDATGKVDSCWDIGNTSMGYGPVFINTYEYDQAGNLTKNNSFAVQANGTLQANSITEFLNYDAFRNPESLSTFSLRQLDPITYFQRNNFQKIRVTQIGGSFVQEINYAYTYNAEGLVTERKNIGTNISEIYSYKCN